MGEIKSTLDLIMEKTKGMTMSDAEKKAFMRNELEGKVRGFLQRFLDGFINTKRVKIEIAGLGDDRQTMAMEILAGESLRKIDLEEDNSRVFEILEQVAGMDVGAIKKALSESKRQLHEQRRAHEKILLDKLKEKGVSGSAVIPNVGADPEWLGYVTRMRKEFQERISGP